jgi:hypothetical protein
MNGTRSDSSIGVNMVPAYGPRLAAFHLCIRGGLKRVLARLWSSPFGPTGLESLFFARASQPLCQLSLIHLAHHGPSVTEAVSLTARLRPTKI